MRRLGHPPGQAEGVSGSQQIQVVLQQNNFGHGTVNIGTAVWYLNGAFSGTANPDKTPIPGIPASAVFTVNDVGAFFNATDNQGRPFTVGKRRDSGGTFTAQPTILIQEPAHKIRVTGFQPDCSAPKAGKANDQLVDTNCRKRIEGLQC